MKKCTGCGKPFAWGYCPECKAKGLDKQQPKAQPVRSPGTAPQGQNTGANGTNVVTSTAAPSWADKARKVAARPQPDQKRKKAAPTEDEVREMVLAQIDKEALTAAARKILSQHAKRHPSVQCTVCFMWKLEGGRIRRVSALSGAPDSDHKYAKLQKRREGLQVPGTKETWCAEENLLCTRGKGLFLFSAAYDNRNGWKRACLEGCRGLLERRGIADLVSPGAPLWTPRAKLPDAVTTS